MNFDWTTFATAIGVVIAFITGIASRRKLDNEATNQIAQAYGVLVQTLQGQMDEFEQWKETASTEIARLKTALSEQQSKTRQQEREIERLKSENMMLQVFYAELKDGVILLIQQIEELGEEPRFRPPWKNDHD